MMLVACYYIKHDTVLLSLLVAGQDQARACANLEKGSGGSGPPPLKIPFSLNLHYRINKNMQQKLYKTQITVRPSPHKKSMKFSTSLPYQKQDWCNSNVLITGVSSLNLVMSLGELFVFYLASVQPEY